MSGRRGGPADEVAAIPLLVGVTGHRDLRVEDREALEATVVAELDRLRARAPHTPLVVVSPLAEGADRLLGRLALARGGRLVVPLPLPRVEYERDFETKASRDEFAGLVAQASSVFFVGWQRGVTPENVGGEDERARQYAAAGAWVVRHCRALVALWDGVDSKKPGGTWEVVKWAREGVPAEFVEHRGTLDAPETRTVIHVATPRTSCPKPTREAFSVEREPASDESETAPDEQRADALTRIDEFNEDARRFVARVRSKMDCERDERLPHEVDAPPSARGELERYVLANELASRFKDAARIRTRIVYGTTFAALVAFEVFAHLSNLAWPALAAYLALFVAAILVLNKARAARVEAKHLDYRALAEGARVQLYWRLTGIESPVSDFYLRMQRDELDWIREALSACAAAAPRPTGPPTAAQALERLRVARARWVKEQADWLAGSAKKRHRSRLAHRLWSRCAFVAGLAVAAGLLVVLAGRIEHDEHLPHEMIAATTVLMLVAALLRASAEKSDFEGEARRYATSAAIFARGLARLDLALEDGRVDVKAARQIVFDLGREALVENASWLLAHRERPLELPTG